LRYNYEISKVMKWIATIVCSPIVGEHDISEPLEQKEAALFWWWLQLQFK